MVNTANPVLLELLIQLAKELVHNPQAGQFSAKATDGAVVWSWKAHIQEEEFAEEEGVVDPFFDFVISMLEYKVSERVSCLRTSFFDAIV